MYAATMTGWLEFISGEWRWFDAPTVAEVLPGCLARRRRRRAAHGGRLTRLTNGFSGRLECAVALHFMHYNFGR